MLAGAACLCFAACKKDSGGGSGKAETLEQGRWQLTALTVNYGIGDMNVLSSVDACQQDNLYTFNADKTITTDEGASKCNSSDPQTTTDGNWALSSGDTKIQLSGSSLTAGYGNIEGDIVTLTNTTFQVKKDTTVSFPGAPSFTGTVKLTFTNTK